MSKSKNSGKKSEYNDLALALQLQEDFNPVGVTENAVFPDNKNKENYQPRTLIDQTLEVIDPTPNIYTLFMQFNARFFSNKLLSVEVKWSKRMTSCAGVCSFHPRNRACIISLSAPLLKLRPRKDLVETLLHEMIHGYLFLTNNNRDRDGHGPEFCKHMDRINKEAGTRITIYHSFHDEVKLYQQHWWRCNGPCQQRHPFFGMVRRAINRAPGPSDFWWKSHQANCGGEFMKVREPEKPQKPAKRDKGQKSLDDKKKPKHQAKGKGQSIDGFFTKPEGRSMPEICSEPVEKTFSTKAPAGLVKLGTSTNRVHGWGTGGPGSSSGRSPGAVKKNIFNEKTSSAARFRTSTGGSALGGGGSNRSNLLDKFSNSGMSSPSGRPSKKAGVPMVPDSPPVKKSRMDDWIKTHVDEVALDDSVIQQLHNCPVCKKSMSPKLLNDHLDACLTNESANTRFVGSTPTKMEDSLIEIGSSPEINNFESKTEFWMGIPCPVCDEEFQMDKLNQHLDACLVKTRTKDDAMEMNSRGEGRLETGARNEHPTKNESNNWLAGSSGETKSRNLIDLTKHCPKDSYVCLVCNARISADIALNDHLDECVDAIFNDDSSDEEYNGKPISHDSSVEEQQEDFPCPVCTKAVPGRTMNQHLDTCLATKN